MRAGLFWFPHFTLVFERFHSVMWEIKNDTGIGEYDSNSFVTRTDDFSDLVGVPAFGYANPISRFQSAPPS